MGDIEDLRNAILRFQKAVSAEKDEHIAGMGEKIAKRRKDMKLTQEQLARYSGISRPQIANIEAGKGISVGTLIRLCYALDTDPNSLLGWKG